MAAKDAAKNAIDLESIAKILDIVKDNATARAVLVFLVLAIVALYFFPRANKATKLFVFVILLLLGIVVLVNPVIEAHRQLANSSFHASKNNLSPLEVTCLTDRGKGEVVPAGTRVCVTMHGSWFGPWGFGISPVGDLRDHPPTYANATHLWTIDAKTNGGKTSESRYVHPNEFIEQADYAVCVRPPDHAETNKDRMAIDIQATDKPHCPVPAAQ